MGIANKIIESELAYKLLKENKEITLYCQYQVIHELQLQKVREKVRRGEKIRVVFMVMQAAKFGYDSIIENMKKTDIFEPIIFVASHFDSLFSSDSSYFEEAKKDYVLVKKMGYETVFAYDDNGVPKPMWELCPDIVFYNELTNLGYYKNMIINRQFLTCYVGYGVIISNRDKKIYRTFQINACWKIFLENRYVYEQYAKYSCLRGMNAVLTGYPKLDKYASLCSISGEYEKRKLVIYAPHWSINDKNGNNLNFSTFPLYFQKMIDMVKQYRDIDFVFKPHPRLGVRIRELEKMGKSFMTYAEYENYLQEWDGQENGRVVTTGDYIELFKNSDCMITDSGSFIYEYLFSGHPCIYMLNPKKKNPFDAYNDVSRKILKTYYCLSTWESIERQFADIMYNNLDPKKEERKEIAKEFVNIGCAGKRIVEFLLTEISK